MNGKPSNACRSNKKHPRNQTESRASIKTSRPEFKLFRKERMQKKFQILALSSLLIGALTACPTPTPTATACSSSTPGLVGVQVGSSVEYTFQGFLSASFGSLPAGTGFAGKVKYAFPQTLNNTNSIGIYAGNYLDLHVGSDFVLSTSARVGVENFSTTLNPLITDTFNVANDVLMTGYVGGLQLKSLGGIWVKLKDSSNNLFNDTALPGTSLTTSNFTSTELILTDINGVTLTSLLC
jgi:hypothetical protein